jgi:predicted phosphodiesterase
LVIAGQNVLCHHGHGIGNPKKYLDSMSRKLKIWFSTLIVGHLHSEEILKFKNSIKKSSPLNNGVFFFM